MQQLCMADINIKWINIRWQQHEYSNKWKIVEKESSYIKELTIDWLVYPIIEYLYIYTTSYRTS